VEGRLFASWGPKKKRALGVTMLTGKKKDESKNSHFFLLKEKKNEERVFQGGISSARRDGLALFVLQREKKTNRYRVKA